MNDHGRKSRSDSATMLDDPPVEVVTGLRAVREQQGKALRKNCSRSGHAEVILGRSKRDPLKLIEQSSKSRLKKLLPIRFTRMAESAFAFFRGTAILQAHDLYGTPAAGIKVQCCGDCHLMNFNGFASPERTLIFDIGDFDETFPGPFEWDVKRLATSLVLASRWLGFDDDDARESLQALLETYRTAMAEFARMSVLEMWYAKTTYDKVLQMIGDDPKLLKRLQSTVDKAVQNTSEHVFHKITQIDHGQSRIVDQPPLLFHAAPGEFDLERDVVPFLEDYRASLAEERRFLFDRFKLVDAAYKVVGVGSVGTRCFIALFAGDQDDHLFLQIKEARPSVLEGHAGDSPYPNNGERIVIGQRLMQSASDIFLGWARTSKGDFYVRQMRDMKVAPNLTDFSPRLLAGYARLCGRSLARAHAKSGDAATIAGYLGSRDLFDQAISQYALAYADQVEQDYETFQDAVRAGRFPIENIPSETETAVR